MKVFFSILLLALGGCAAAEPAPLPGSSCLRCETPLGADDRAYACSYECTFCPMCSEDLNHVCPNCQGSLEAKPDRGKGPLR